jgi:hypothetical protein
MMPSMMSVVVIGRLMNKEEIFMSADRSSWLSTVHNRPR